MKIYRKVLGRHPQPSHGKRPCALEVCFHAECSLQLICRICHLFTHNDATVHSAASKVWYFSSLCVFQGRLSLLSFLSGKEAFFTFRFSEENTDERGDYLSCFHSHLPDSSSFPISLPSPPLCDEFVIVNGFSRFMVHLVGATWPCLAWTDFVVFE